MGKKTPQGKTNREAYTAYRSYVQSELRDLATIQTLRDYICRAREEGFLRMLVGFWSSRYYRRMEAIDPLEN